MSYDLLYKLSDRLIIDEPCWEWAGTINFGYGIVRHESKNCRVHILMYEMFVGSVPEGMQLDHLCRNRKCCRPDHLEPVTSKENVRRGLLALAAPGKPCSQGHLNWKWMARQNRFVCPDCRRESQRKRRAG